MASDPTDLIRDVDLVHASGMMSKLDGPGVEECCAQCGTRWPCEVRRLRDALAASEARKAQLGVYVADAGEDLAEAQRWARWFAAERDDAQQWSQHFEYEMKEAQVSVVQFQQECTAQFPDLDDNCGPDEVASAIHMLRVERNNAFAAIRNMQENNLHREAALAEANATIERAQAVIESPAFWGHGTLVKAAIRRAIEGPQS